MTEEDQTFLALKRIPLQQMWNQFISHVPIVCEMSEYFDYLKEDNCLPKIDRGLENRFIGTGWTVEEFENELREKFKNYSTQM